MLLHVSIHNYTVKELSCNELLSCTGNRTPVAARESAILLISIV